MRPNLSKYLDGRIRFFEKKSELESERFKEWETALRIFCKKLTIEINYWEQKKNDCREDAETLFGFEKKLSDWYFLLALFFEDDFSIKRECILTAYSLNPTESNFEVVSKCNSKDNTNNENLSTYCIPEWLQSDVQYLLTWPRIKTLSWSKSWLELRAECQIYLQSKKKIERIRMATAAANNDLKNLNDKLNYKLYANWKSNNCPGGIEAGFENDMNLDVDEPLISSQLGATSGKTQNDKAKLHQNGVPFIQDESCDKFDAKLKCYDCKNSKNKEDIVRRFIQFRKHRYSNKRHFELDGFLHPTEHPTTED